MDGAPPLVLVVDDDEGLRRMMAILLSRGGYRVTAAADGEEALASLAVELPSLIISDLQMPHCDGVELNRRLERHAVWRRLPLLIVTGSVDDLPVELTRRARVLRKPLAPRQLIAAVERTLAVAAAAEAEDIAS